MINDKNELLYITREKQTFNHKPIIYLCSYPGTSQLITELWKDTVKLIDAIVCYKKEKDESIELNSLDNISIMILPVTSELFTTRNASVFDEITYVKEKNIPIIFVCYDEIIESSLYEKVGNYPIIYKQKINEHFLSFEDNYQTCLNHFLLTSQEEELINKVSTIKSYISYAKGDNESLDIFKSYLINEDERFILGASFENLIDNGSGYDESRKEKIDESSIVFLILSKEAIRSENVKNDYLYALNIRKNVIPIIVDSSIKKEVRKEFKKLTNIYELNKKLSKRLSKELKKNGIKKPLESLNTEYAFLLASLYGYGLRKDFTYVNEKINKLVDLNYILALKKKKEMLLYGLGVKPDYNELKIVERKLISACKEKYELIQDVNNGLSYLKELYDYANYDITDAHEKIDVFKTLMESAINLWNLTKNLKVKKYIALSYKNQGIYYLDLNDYENSNEFITKYVIILKEYDEQTKTILSGKMLVESYLLLAKMYDKFDEIKKAQEVYSLSIEKFEALLMLYKDKTILKKEFAYLLDKYAIFLDKHHMKEEVIQCLQRNSFIYEDLVSMSKKLEDMYLLIDAYEKLAKAYEENDKKYDLALKYLEKAHDIRSMIITDYRSLATISEYAKGFNELGRIADLNGDKEKTFLYYEKAIKYYEVVATKENTITMKKELGKTLLDISKIYNKYNDNENKENALKRSKLIWEELVTKQENIVIKSVCEIKYYLALTTYLLALNDKDELYKSMRLFEELLSKDEYKYNILELKENIKTILEDIYNNLLFIYKDDKNRLKEYQMRKEVMLSK